MLANVGAEYVHHDIPEIHQNPLRGGDAFDAARRVAPSGEHGIDVVCDGAYLALGFS